MDIQQIISELEAERDRITQAITALQGVQSPNTTHGRRAASANRRRGPRRLSPAARKRISEAAKKRWAKAKAAGKKSL